MSELAIQVQKNSSRLGMVEDMVFKNQPDHQPAINLCRKYKIGRSFRDRLVKEGVINEYRLLGKIYFKESELIAAMEDEMAKKAAA